MISKDKTERTDAVVWDLCLYVAGETGRSRHAIANLTQICEHHLRGQYQLTVIDLLEQPHLAATDEVLATPTVIRRSPTPSRTVVGDLSQSDRVIAALAMQTPFVDE